MSATTTASTLPSLLSSTGLLLSYALPLFFTSLLITFAGTFLTLDRTRSFPRAYDAIVPDSFDKKPRRKDLYLLGGGIGGLASGLVFGVHFTTFLTLLIPNVTSNGPLGDKAFLAVWLISTVITTIIGGRWRYSAIVFSGLTGGCLFSLLLNIILHPALTTRVVLTSTFTPLILLLTLLPFPIIQYSALRLANASLGSVGLVISIALLAHEPNWSNPWERYWVHDGWEWGTGSEKGLGAAACILIVIGIVCDWALKRRFGECPDEQWDSYLSKYSANLPDRPGMFRPARGFLDKLFHHGDNDFNGGEKRDIIFPDDDSTSKLKQGFISSPLPPPAYDIRDLERSAMPRGQQGGNYLKKAKSQASHTQRFTARNLPNNRKRGAIKFQPLGDLSSSDEDDDDESHPPPKPWVKRSQPSTTSSSSGHTLINHANEAAVDYDKDLEALKQSRKGFGDREVPDYSDGEDITVAESSSHGRRTPVRKVSGGSSSPSHKEDGWSPKFIQERKGSGSGSGSSKGSTAFKPVPATPSLIRAIDRVHAAQREAYSNVGEGLPNVAEERDVVEQGRIVEENYAEKRDEEKKTNGGWNSFWREVERKNRTSRDADESVRGVAVGNNDHT